MPGAGRRWQLLSLWLGGPVFILALALRTVYSHWPIAVVALGIAYLPAFLAGSLALSSARTRFGLRGSLDLLSVIALGGVLLSQHSVLPAWLVVLGAAAAALSLITAGIALLIWQRRRNRPS